MSVRSYLQYDYVWSRDNGDSSYTGILDRVKVDKDEGYEVVYFIEDFLNKYDLPLDEHNVALIEELLHSPLLSNVQMRDELIEKIGAMIPNI